MLKAKPKAKQPKKMQEVETVAEKHLAEHHQGGNLASGDVCRIQNFRQSLTETDLHSSIINTFNS